jgi:hypothetical protein
MSQESEQSATLNPQRKSRSCGAASGPGTASGLAWFGTASGSGCAVRRHQRQVIAHLRCKVSLLLTLGQVAVLTARVR